MSEIGSPNFIAGCAVLFFCSTLAAAGGIGGGALNVPILLAVFGYPYKEAVVLSLCAVAGNTLSQVAVNIRKRHPLDKSRPLIYFDAALVLTPAQLGGNDIGVVLASILPTTVLMVIAVAVILFAVYMTGSKGMHLYEVESAMKQEPIGDVENGDDASRCSGSSTGSRASLMISDNWLPRISDAIHTSAVRHGETIVVLENEDTGETQVGRYSMFDDKDGPRRSDSMVDSKQAVLVEPSTRQQLVVDTFSESQLRQQSVDRAQVNSTAWPQQDGTSKDAGGVALVSMNQLIAGHTGFNPEKSPISATGHTSDGTAPAPLELVYPMFCIYMLGVVMLYFVGINTSMAEVGKCSHIYWLILAMSYPGLGIIMYYCVGHVSEKQRVVANVLPGDLDFTEGQMTRPAAAFVIGITCSLLGIGGGELFGPFMLLMKVIPQVSSATTSLMSLISASNNIVHHSIIGSLPFESGIILFGVGMSAGIVGRIGALKITKLFGRPSILIFVLAGILFASAMIMLASLVTATPSFAFDSACA